MSKPSNKGKNANQHIQDFIDSITENNYAAANTSLVAAVHEKLVARVRETAKEIS